MNTYYIATSSLNFNNILSSESISPKSFYEKRNFGYQRWAEIHEDVCDNVIVLYSNQFSFTRPKSDLEDRPLLIEIYTNKEFEQVSDGIFCCDHTLYLNPTTTRFIFFNEEDKKVTLSMSDSSLETKLIKLYGKRIGVLPNLPIKEALFNQKVEKECNLKAIETDKKTNKIKGLLYGYYIGAYLSEDFATIQRRNNFQDLLELFSVIRTRSIQQPTIEEIKQLEELLFAIQLPDSHSLRNKIKSIELSSEERQLFNQYEQLFKNESDFVDAYQISILLKDEFEADGKTQKPNRAIEWLEALKAKFEKSIVHKPLKDDEIITANLSLEKLLNKRLNEKENALFLKWTNEILCQEQYNSKISTFNKELSDELTRNVKEQFGNEWENSAEKTLLNLMRRYLRGEDVNIEWKDDLISAMTAVLKEGNDWEKFLRFMQRKGMCDYRLAFAIYGELNGFANLTRDFTDIVYEMTDKEYVWNLYKEICGQLLSDDFEIIEKQESGLLLGSQQQVEDKAQKNVVEKDSPAIDNNINETIHTELNSENKGNSIIDTDVSQQQNIKEKASTTEEKFDINTMINDLKGKITDDTIIKLNKWCKESNGSLDKFKNHVASLKNCKGRDDIFKYLGINNPSKKSAKNTKNTKTSEQLELPIDNQNCSNFAQEKTSMQTPENNEKYFVFDDNAWKKIEKFVPEKLRKELRKEYFDWLIEDLRKEDGKRKYYNGIDNKNNEIIIQKFCNQNDKKVPFSKELRQTLKTELLKIYGNR